MIEGLQDSENLDRFQISLETAAGLIRRKANLGFEVRDHAQSLASLLLGLKDPFGLEEFEEHRTKAMTTLLLAEPEQIGLQYSHAYFTGDYAISQRITILQAITSGARALAGLDNSDATSNSELPTKSLPERLHLMYLSADAGQLSGPARPIMSNLSAKSHDRKRHELIARALFLPLIGRSHLRGRSGFVLP